MAETSRPDPWGRSTSSDEFNTLACVNFAWNPWLGYAEGFRRAGRVLVDYLARSGDQQHFLVYPIVFNYRLALEIALKQVILFGRRLLGESGDFPDTHTSVTCGAPVARFSSGSSPTIRGCRT